MKLWMNSIRNFAPIRMLFDEEEEKEHDTLTLREIDDIDEAVLSKQDVQEVVNMEVVKKLDAYYMDDA